jgi:hypothetical protein
MTQLSTIPGTPAALPGVAAPALPGTAAPEFPPVVPSRTPQLLQRLQVLIALALLVAGAVSVWVISDLRNDLASAPNLAQQYARLGQVQHSLTSAARLTAESVITGEAAGGRRASDATKQLGTAAGLLVEAARDRPQDADELSTLSQAVLTYSQTLAAIPGTPRATALPQLTAADVQLDKLLSGIASLQTRLTTEAASRPWSQSTPWATLACLAMLAVVVWAAWLVAQRSHRVLNLGLAAAGAALLVLLGTTAAAQGLAASASDASRGTQFGHVVNTTLAVTQLDAAQRVLTTAVVTQHWDSTSVAAYTKAFQAASRAAAPEDLPSLKSFDTAKNTLADQMTKGEWKAAATTLLADSNKSLAGTASTFLDDANNVLTSAVTDAATGPASARAGLVADLVVAIVLALAGAALGILGLYQRLREYR